MDTLFLDPFAGTRRPGGYLSRFIATALVPIACGVAVPIPAAATTVPAGQTVVVGGNTNLDQLSMQGGTLQIFNDGGLGPLSATGSVLANGSINAVGPAARLELSGTTTIPGASFGAAFPTDGMYISASGAESPFPLDVVNKGEVFQSGNGRLTLGGAARFVNDEFSTFWIQNDLGMARTSPAAQSGFVNLPGASLIKSAGTGTSVFLLPVAQDFGKVETWSGTIELAAGGFHADSTFFADGLLNNPAAPYGIVLGGSHVFTGLTTTGNGSLLLAPGARIDVVRGGQSSFGEWRQQATFIAEGAIDIDDATLHNQSGGTLTTGPGGSITGGNGGRLLNDGVFRGDIRASGPELDRLIDVENAGTFEVAGGGLVAVNSFSGLGGSTTIDADGELNAQTFVQDGGDTVVNGLLATGQAFFNAGTVQGAGTITYDSGVTSAVIFGSGLTVRPANSPGILTIDGNLEASGTTFDIEIAGPDAGTLFDQLVVTGEARFDGGILNLRFIDGFVPSESDVFQWLVASGGAFGIDTLTINVFSDLATIDGWLDSDGRYFVTSVVPIPLPPAAWALGTALLGLGALSRRRSAAA